MKNLKDLPYRNGVGIMIFNDQKKIFVGKRIDNQEAWQMPQGGVDKDEDYETAAKRELFEETGIQSVRIVQSSKQEFIYDLPNHLLGKIWKGKYKGQKQKWFLMKFLGPDSEINISQKHPEFNEWKWVDLDELPRLIVPFKKKLYESIIKEFRTSI
ncbi:MAG: RNA pyrophosphohydrolase [Pelagibacteraceae bacterium]|nr:RNA pyrophosphohydrolase [Pelagibacteraceae bacterium]OUV88919.1 MAG: RNA pyrophosphohydrolase [Pelagibacteraceae bacterium TMED146]|tara:strand:- start:1433 stop:1900 length:468 start_codon:yes stop_codon:yes gene_type:complete